MPADPALQPSPSDDLAHSIQKINALAITLLSAPDPAWQPSPTDSLHASAQKMNAIWWEFVNATVPLAQQVKALEERLKLLEVRAK